MTADDLTAPLSRRPKRRKINVPATPIIVGVLALFLAVFVLWSLIADDPFGGEPVAAVRADMHVAAKPPAPSILPATTPQPSAQPQQAAAAPPPGAQNKAMRRRIRRPSPSSTARPANATTSWCRDPRTAWCRPKFQQSTRNSWK
jgi:hypothetical protein